MLIRILERTYVQGFFTTGMLRLTTLSRCRILEDAKRRDPSEGTARFGLTYGSEGIYGIQTFGRQSYLLCVSHVDRAEDIVSENETYFCIDNLDAFGNAVAKCIPGFKRFRHGACVYIPPEKVVDHVSPVPIHPDATRLLHAAQTGDQALVEDAFHEMNRQMSARVAALPDPFLYKPDCFAHEKEHRLIWECDHDVSEYLDIICPAAVDYCTAGP